MHTDLLLEIKIYLETCLLDCEIFDIRILKYVLIHVFFLLNTFAMIMLVDQLHYVRLHYNDITESVGAQQHYYAFS